MWILNGHSQFSFLLLLLQTVAAVLRHSLLPPGSHWNDKLFLVYFLCLHETLMALFGCTSTQSERENEMGIERCVHVSVHFSSLDVQGSMCERMWNDGCKRK